MPGTTKASYSRYALAAARHLGQLVRLKRIERRITSEEFADRLGVSRGTVQRLERGDPKVALGIAFEACALLGIPLFEEEQARLTARIDDTGQRLALLPKAARARAAMLDDDF
jgi:transcriptional regulator with XRE-family HTH domain